MSQYSEYIENVLKNEYEQVAVLRDSETSHIEVFKHRQTDNKLVRICSKNRNDHIFRSLRGYRHPNLPTIFDVCADEDSVTVLEGFVEGETLATLMKKNTVSKQKAVAYVRDICDALSFLHAKNIVHRDIKPSNIIVNENDKAVLIDFSSAREISGTSESDTVNLGTPGYAAPEQYGVYQSLPATDIYALGVLFNELMIGTNPIIQTPEGKLGRIIKKCTSSQISERYQSIEDLEKDLKKYIRFGV